MEVSEREERNRQKKIKKQKTMYLRPKTPQTWERKRAFRLKEANES